LPLQQAETAAKPAVRAAYETTKRAMDFLLSGALLLALSPLLLLIAALVKGDSKGPVLFAREVVGENGQTFRLYKFRSMQAGSENENHRRAVLENMTLRRPTQLDTGGNPIYKTSLVDSQRITRTGRFLRRTSLDELPQLWNVLLGQMSLVGPRPALPYEAELYDETQRERFLVKPGITGLYQVTARNRVPIEEMIRIDLEYVRNRSLSLDLWIMFRTPKAMFRGL
jgi:lipopolysaccharide/colanic/teichoic acid biosynthesis glycosyltransferase